MALRLRTLFFILVSILSLSFLYLEREILTPFILGALFAYVCTPVVNFFSEKIRFPRTFSIVLIYLFLVGGILFLGVLFTTRIVNESNELGNVYTHLLFATKAQINSLPAWIKPALSDWLISLEKSKFLSVESLFLFFPAAFSRIVSFFIFIVSGFYFLQEGKVFIEKTLAIVPNAYKIDVEILVRRMNSVMGAYLRGQLFLVFFVASLLFILLSILGVRFAFLVAIFSGFAELVPLIGPIIATAVAALIAFVIGVSNFNLSPLSLAGVVILIYFLTRQFQDYFITPFIMGRITKVHPFVIFFAVLAGGHVFGLLGFILAIPVAAAIKIIFEFLLDKVNEEPTKKS